MNKEMTGEEVLKEIINLAKFMRDEPPIMRFSDFERQKLNEEYQKGKHIAFQELLVKIYAMQHENKLPWFQWNINDKYMKPVKEQDYNKREFPKKTVQEVKDYFNRFSLEPIDGFIVNNKPVNFQEIQNITIIIGKALGVIEE